MQVIFETESFKISPGFLAPVVPNTPCRKHLCGASSYYAALHGPEILLKVSHSAVQYQREEYRLSYVLVFGVVSEF